MDGADYSFVFCRVYGVVLFQVWGHICKVCRLEEWDSAACSWSRTPCHKCVGRVGGAKGADEELLAEHAEVVLDWEHFALGVEVGDVGFED